MPMGDPGEDQPLHFHLQVEVLTQQRLLMSKAPCSLNYFDVFIVLSCIFSIFSIKIPPILVNTNPQSYSKSIPAVNN